MEEEKKASTSEPNPTGENEVNTADLEDEGGQGKPTEPTGKEGDSQDQQKSEKDGKTQANPKQSREEDAKYAEERRKRKTREEARQKAREEEIRRQAVFEVKSGQVTSDELKELGLDKVEDEDQLFLVESLRKAKADGAENPQADAYKALYKKQADDKANAKAKADAEEAEKSRIAALVAADQKAFKEKFGKTTAEVMANEPEFKELFGEALDAGNFTAIYTAYSKLKKDASATAKKQGSFPTNSDGNVNKDGESESNEDFKKRWVAEHGHW